MPSIGYIAISGVRVHDQDLLDLGLNLPGFVQRSEVIASLPSLGLLTLAGLTPAGFDHEYLEVPEVDEFDSSAHDFDVVAISSFSAKIKDAYRLADRFRKMGAHVVMGGLHVTSLPKEALGHADTVILGEAETRWGEFLSDWSAGAPGKVYDCRSRKFALKDAPMPAFELLDVDKYNRLTVQTQRGCPWRCSFCASSSLLTSCFKTKPVEKVIAEIRAIKDIWPEPFIEFADDNTFASTRHGRELARAMAKEGVRWFTETDISVADDPELLKQLADSGCAQLLIGFESPDKAALDGLEENANWKRKKFDHYMRSIERIQNAGITVNGCFVLGLDGSGPESFERVFDFINDSHLYEAQLTLMTPFPGTPFYNRLLAEGRILEPGAWEKCTLFDINYRPQKMTVDQLRENFMDLMARVYDDTLIAQRRQRFRDRRAQLLRDAGSQHATA